MKINLIIRVIFWIIISYTITGGHASIREDDVQSEEQMEWLFQTGRRLFYDKKLSSDGTLSCATCHQQKFAFSYGIDIRYPKADDRLIRNHLSNERSILPLFNLYQNEKFMWDGRANSLSEQVLLPIYNKHEFNTTLNTIVAKVKSDSSYRKLFQLNGFNGTIDSVSVIKAFLEFEGQLISNDSKYDRFLRGEAVLDTMELRGLAIMKDTKRGNCFSCHVIDIDQKNNKQKMKNNGMLFSLEKEIFLRTPSIRNLAYTNPYGHNGEFDWVDVIVEFYSGKISKNSHVSKEMKHYLPNGLKLSKSEKVSILKFLATLNDSTFVSNPRFSNPFDNG